MEPTPTTSLFQLNIDANSSYALRGAASWAKVMGIIGLLFGILFILIGVLIQGNKAEFVGGVYEGYNAGRGDMNGNLVANLGIAVYVVFGLIFVISSLFALRFSSKAGRALRSNDPVLLGNGFSAVRNYFAFWAVLMIVMLLLTIVGVVGMISAASNMR